MKKAIVIGSGAGGAMMARELQGHFQVTVLEGWQRISAVFHQYQQACRASKDRTVSGRAYDFHAFSGHAGSKGFFRYGTGAWQMYRRHDRPCHRQCNTL
ncbi:MAG: hypothetical protein LUF27_06185 [Lachnospiraceae bacterium]|nr:hypothetical protein [Lachnospiraceae bacterium]